MTDDAPRRLSFGPPMRFVAVGLHNEGGSHVVGHVKYCGDAIIPLTADRNEGGHLIVRLPEPLDPPR